MALINTPLQRGVAGAENFTQNRFNGFSASLDLTNIYTSDYVFTFLLSRLVARSLGNVRAQTPRWDVFLQRFFQLATQRLLPQSARMFKPADLFDLGQTEHASLFDGCEYAWDALKRIEAYLQTHLRPALHNRCDGVAYIGERVFIGEGTVVEDGVMIKGPAIIGRNCHLRHNAYLRENVILGDKCVIGNSCEVKNSLLFNDAGAPHFNYIGDSILGHQAHLGAGVKISNVKLVAGNILVEAEGKRFDTGLRKFGALLGDNADIGCNAVLNPGSIIGRGSVVYPNTNWRGVLPPNRIVKNRAEQEIIERR